MNYHAGLFFFLGWDCNLLINLESCQDILPKENERPIGDCDTNTIGYSKYGLSCCEDGDLVTYDTAVVASC